MFKLITALALWFLLYSTAAALQLEELQITNDAEAQEHVIPAEEPEPGPDPFQRLAASAMLAFYDAEFNVVELHEFDQPNDALEFDSELLAMEIPQEARILILSGVDVEGAHQQVLAEIPEDSGVVLINLSFVALSLIERDHEGTGGRVFEREEDDNEATPINLPSEEDDSNEATPINLP